MNNELVKDCISKFPVMWGSVMEMITDCQKANGAALSSQAVDCFAKKEFGDK
jgi:hypothetical protein